MRFFVVPVFLVTVFLATMLLTWANLPAQAQMGPGGPPPAVGVVEARRQPVTESSEFIGRVEAINRVELRARITGFLEERLFQEGTEVEEGKLLFRMERAPFEAQLEQARANVASAEAQLTNARTALARARELRTTGAGTQVALDNAQAQERTSSATLLGAQAAALEVSAPAPLAAAANPLAAALRAPLRGVDVSAWFAASPVVAQGFNSEQRVYMSSGYGLKSIGEGAQPGCPGAIDPFTTCYANGICNCTSGACTCTNPCATGVDCGTVQDCGNGDCTGTGACTCNACWLNSPNGSCLTPLNCGTGASPPPCRLSAVFFVVWLTSPRRASFDSPSPFSLLLASPLQARATPALASACAPTRASLARTATFPTRARDTARARAACARAPTHATLAPTATFSTRARASARARMACVRATTRATLDRPVIRITSARATACARTACARATTRATRARIATFLTRARTAARARTACVRATTRATLASPATCSTIARLRVLARPVCARATRAS
jgi:hypothetical protein